MILQTGGSAFGAISTRSRPALFARRKASSMLTIPTFSPFSSTRRTLSVRMRSLIRYSCLLLIFFFSLINKIRNSSRIGVAIYYHMRKSFVNNLKGQVSLFIAFSSIFSHGLGTKRVELILKGKKHGQYSQF